MGTYTYTLSAPSQAKTIHMIDGGTAKLVTLSYFCRSNDHDPENAYDEKDRRERQCLSNVLERKREAWCGVNFPEVYAVLVHTDRSGKPEEGCEVYRWQGKEVSPHWRTGEPLYDYDPLWFDCLEMQGKLVGHLRRERRKWVLAPNEPALVVLARQAL